MLAQTCGRRRNICTSKPKPPPAPVIPQTYQGKGAEIVDQDSLDARDKQRRRITSAAGRQSTLLTNTGIGSGLPPTSGAKVALGA